MEDDLRNLITVLNLDPVEADHASLENILTCSRWKLRSKTSVEAAIALLQESRVPVLFCETDQRLGHWQKTLDQVMSLPDPPYLIVTSRLADDRLWAEALNLGAYDVLAKPFDRTEVTRIVGSACARWDHRQPIAAKSRSCAA